MAALMRSQFERLLYAQGATWVHSESDKQIWVSFGAGSAQMPKARLEVIADAIGKDYQRLTGLPAVHVTIWHPMRERVLAKGHVYAR